MEEEVPSGASSGQGEGGAARRVAANALNPFAAQVATRLLMLGYAVVQYRVLGAQAGGVLGDYFLAGIVLMYTGTISEWGLGTLLTRDVARNRGEVGRVAHLFGQTLVVRLLISLALFLPVGLFILLYTSLFDLSAGGAWAVAILALSLLPAAFSGTVTALLYAYERMTLPALVGIGTSVLNVVLGLAALAAGMGVVGLAFAAFLSTCLTALYFLKVMKRDLPEVGGITADHLRVDWPLARRLLGAGWPLMLNGLLVGLFFRVDQFIIQPVVGGLGVERYQAAYSYLNFVLLITPAVTLALFPRMARHAVDDIARLAYEYRFALKVLLALSGVIVLGTIWLAPLLVTVVTGGKEGYLPESAAALRILILFLPLSFVNGITQYVLIALDKQRLITRAFALTVFFNVAANLALVPWLGINGAAITTVLSEVVLMAPFALWVRRYLGAGQVRLLSWAWRPLLAGVVGGLAAYALWPVQESWSRSPADFALYLGVGLGAACLYIAVLAILRPFSRAEWQALVSVLKRGGRGEKPPHISTSTSSGTRQ